jgi:hypothetical protein
MEKENLIQLTGARLACASNCPINHHCFGGYVNETLECDESVNALRKIFSIRGYTTLVMTQRFFGIRVLDSFSEKRPLPEIGDILIEDGNLTLRKGETQ